MKRKFDWHPLKARTNRRDHHITFEQAVQAFDDKLAVEWIDDRQYHGEERVNVLGMCAGVLLHVTYTERGEYIRIISARRAERHERDDYFRQNSR